MLAPLLIFFTLFSTLPPTLEARSSPNQGAERKEFQLRAKGMKIDLSRGWIEINIPRQRLRYWRNDSLVCSYRVSTARRGIGQLEGTGKTPLGWHLICQKIGKGSPLYTIFKARQDTGRCWSPSESCDEDLILTRILRLEGLEPSLNRGKDLNGRCVDSFKRMIYIHGTHQEALIGQPASHGCIRMRNADLLWLFELLELRTPVWIHDDPDFAP